MTTTKHLEKIKAKCQERINKCEGNLPCAEAGWKSTISAIETAQLLESVNSDITNAILDSIIAAWPKSTLAIV